MERKVFKIQELNCFFWEINDFTSLLFEFRQAGRDKLLSLYLGLLSKCKRFSAHKEGVFDDLGFRLDKSGVTEDVLRDNGVHVKNIQSL